MRFTDRHQEDDGQSHASPETEGDEFAQAIAKSDPQQDSGGH